MLPNLFSRVVEGIGEDYELKIEIESIVSPFTFIYFGNLFKKKNKLKRTQSSQAQPRRESRNRGRHHLVPHLSSSPNEALTLSFLLSALKREAMPFVQSRFNLSFLLASCYLTTYFGLTAAASGCSDTQKCHPGTW